MLYCHNFTKILISCRFVSCSLQDVKDVYTFYLKTNFLATGKKISSPHCTVPCEYHKQCKLKTMHKVWLIKVITIVLLQS